MKIRTLAPFLALLPLALPCSADTFTLKDGTVLEGTVVSETSDSYLLEVQVTKSIRDERKVAKAEVAKVDRVKPELIAFEPVAKLVPIPDLLTPADYAAKIKVVDAYLAKFPTGPQAREAKAIREKLSSESAQIAAGAVKLDGKIIPASEYQSNAYDIDARLMETRIRAMVADGNTLAALRAFSEFDKDFRTSLAYGSLAPFMIQVIKSHAAETKETLSTLDQRLKEREIGLQRMAPADRAATQNAIDEETNAVEKRFQAEKAGGKSSWPTPSPFHKASLEDTIQFAQQEITRLSSVSQEVGIEGGKAFRELYSTINSGQAAAAELAAAKTAQIPARYLEPLEAKAKSATAKP